LTGLATHGVIYAEGRAGTLQEIFEDGAQNYYHTYGAFSPMIFLSANYWTTNIPVKPVLEALFKSDDFKNNVLFTDDPAEVIAFVKSHSSAQTPVERLRNYLYYQ
jgi:predicted Rossmann-fold nucleotide-binding protein